MDSFIGLVGGVILTGIALAFISKMSGGVQKTIDTESNDQTTPKKEPGFASVMIACFIFVVLFIIIGKAIAG